jgi:CubicO group peptidase (beta-lactamase class C family)
MLDAADPEVAAALALVDARLAAEQRDQGVPGLSAGIVADQQLLWARGYGHAVLAPARRAGPETVYRVGSVTKLVTAAMLMQLRDAGRLHLDDPITAYLPEFRLRSRFADHGPPTLRQLVTHTAGLPREAPLDYGDTNTIPPIGVLLASLRDTDLSLAPLTEFKYSNLGVAVLAHALERIAGRPYVEYVAEHVLGPLGMAHSGFDRTLTEAVRERLAQGYYSAPDAPPTPAPYLEPGGMNATGGLYTTVEDVAKFIMLQFRDAPAGGDQILRGATLREMRAPCFLDDDWQGGTGIAWRLGRLGAHPFVRHGGNLDGYHADVSLLPRLRLGVAVFANGGINTGALSRAALEVLAPVAARRRDRQEAAQLPAAPADCERYVGRYRVLGAEAAVALHRGRLVFHFAGQRPEDGAVLTLERDRTFRLRGGGVSNGELVVFELDGTGKAAALRYMDSVGRRAQPTKGGRGDGP